MITLIFSLLIALVVLTLGVLTLTSSRDGSSKAFSLLTTIVACWIVANQLGSNTIISLNARHVLTYIDYQFGVIMAAGFLLLVAELIRSKLLLTIAKKVVIPITIAFAILVVFNQVVDVYVINESLTVDESSLFLPYTVFIAICAMTGVAFLVKSYREARGKEKRILQLTMWGLSVSAFTLVVSNTLVPLVFSDIEYSSLAGYSSYLSVLFFAIFIWIAISKHKLFNLRYAASRSLTYFASVSGVVAIYTMLILLLSGTDIISNNVSNSQRVAFAVIAVISGFLFQPFKKFFDKLTNRIFYRDSYDSQQLIDDLNQALVTNTNIDSLLTKASLLLQENLKSTFVTFYIRETAYFPPRVIGAHRKSPEYKDIKELQRLAAISYKKIVISNNSWQNEEEKVLKEILRSNDIDVMARLVSTLEYRVNGMGYLFIGQKKSGTPYSSKDLRIIEIITNELVIAVENVLRYEEIEQFNVTLQKKIDDATKELKQTNQKLLALDEAKDEFVSMASHQLRTPLTSIKGYLSMVLEGDMGKISESQKEMLGQAFFSSQRMVYLISDLLNVSRLKTGKFTIEKKPVYLPDLVDSEISQLSEGAKAKNLTLSFSKPDKFPTLSLDEMKLRQVVMNFTDNAIYYTPQGGKITVELKETPKSVEFKVTDSGIGVPKAEQHKLFTKFYRAENARKTRPDGTGLGLFMAKKVVVAQGGSIIFDSKEGKGSTFGFSFPKANLLAVETLQKTGTTVKNK